MKYEHIFFDLDHTLWDFERNATETLQELFEKYNLTERTGCKSDFFSKTFHETNHELWKMLDRNIISKEYLRENRFPMVFEKCGINFENAEEFSDLYSQICPNKPHLLPHAIETLDYLHPKYTLHIITNGFQEAQPLKMKSGGITHYFKTITLSETAGYKKPDKRIFDFAFEKAGTRPEFSLMVGDAVEADILGGNNAGMDTVLFNPNQNPHEAKPTYEISSLHTLIKML